MKNNLAPLFAVLALTTAAFGADNTIGTWKYNAEKSKTAAGLSPIASLTQTIETAGRGVKITAMGERADGSKLDYSTSPRYDGKAVAVTGTGAAWDMAGYKQLNPNTITIGRSKKGGKYKSKVRTVISPDGKTMTASASGTGANGKPFTSVTVFDRQ